MQKALTEGRKTGEALRFSFSHQKLRGGIGDRLGSGVGSSLEFQDYREYQPGDDLRHLDWSAYARTDKLTLRLYREEIQPRVDIISDSSASMNAPDSAKARVSLFLAGLFAEAAFRSESTAAWWGFGNGWKNYFKASNAFPEDFSLPEWGGGYSIDEEFARRIPRFSPKGIRICVSDFLWETPPEIPLRKLSETASELIIAAVLSEEELDPPLYGAATLADSETDEKLDLMVGASEKAAYLKRLDSHIEMWKDCASSIGAKYCLIKASENNPPDIEPLVEAGVLEWV
jgi:hypothetical protein